MLSSIKRNVVTLTSVFLYSFLFGCNAEHKNTDIQERKLCFVDVGGSFGKSGLRARQYIGKGPKFRIIQWKTLDFPDDLDLNQEQKLIDNHASLAAKISWRVSEVNGRIESQLDSLELIPINFKDEQLHKIASWRLIGVDGEKYSFPITENIKNSKPELFSAESKGIIIPGTLAEDLGGVNGSSFKIGALDANGVVLLQKDILASSGYMFKERAMSAIEKLDEIVKMPNKCQKVSD